MVNVHNEKERRWGEVFMFLTWYASLLWLCFENHHFTVMKMILSASWCVVPTRLQASFVYSDSRHISSCKSCINYYIQLHCCFDKNSTLWRLWRGCFLTSSGETISWPSLAFLSTHAMACKTAKTMRNACGWSHWVFITFLIWTPFLQNVAWGNVTSPAHEWNVMKCLLPKVSRKDPHQCFKDTRSRQYTKYLTPEGSALKPSLPGLKYKAGRPSLSLEEGRSISAKGLCRPHTRQNRKMNESPVERL